jgi:hypothetical protein
MFVQQVAIDEKLAKENLVSSGEVCGHDADEGLLVSA